MKNDYTPRHVLVTMLDEGITGDTLVLDTRDEKEDDNLADAGDIMLKAVGTNARGYVFAAVAVGIERDGHPELDVMVWRMTLRQAEKLVEKLDNAVHKLHMQCIRDQVRRRMNLHRHLRHAHAYTHELRDLADKSSYDELHKDAHRRGRFDGWAGPHTHADDEDAATGSEEADE